MSKVLTSNELIDSLKRRGMIPENQETFDTDDFLDILNEEMDMYILPYLLSVHEEYLVNSEDQALTTGTIRYAIPYRAIGNKLRGLFFVDDNENETKYTRVSIEDKDDYYVNGAAFYGHNSAFFVENNNIVLIEDPSTSSGSLRMYFYLRPSRLVKDSEAGLITGVDTTTGVISMSNYPTTFATLPLMDFVGKKTPNKIKGYDIQPSSVDSNTKTVTFDTDDLPSDLVVGDYLNLAEESIVPQIPTELHGLLAQKASLTCIEAIGDLESAKLVEAKLDKIQKNIYNLIDNRVESSPQKVRNRFSTLRVATGKNRTRFRW